MPFLILNGVHPYDGRYELKMDGGIFTIFEWGWLKRFAGIYPTTLWDGFDNADQELVATLAVIALHRAGRITDRDAKDTFDLIGRGEMGATIQIEADPAPAEEADEPPLPSRQTVNGSSSGDGSLTSSESPANGQSPTGTPASDTSASASTTLAT